MNLQVRLLFLAQPFPAKFTDFTFQVLISITWPGTCLRRICSHFLKTTEGKLCSVEQGLGIRTLGISGLTNLGRRGV